VTFDESPKRRAQEQMIWRYDGVVGFIRIIIEIQLEKSRNCSNFAVSFARGTL